ncbi:MAG TPA: methylated-DNA--[protein]-cysteine S-methyltransferase [Azospirillum sp.]
MGLLTIDSPLGSLLLRSGGGAMTTLDWGASPADDPDDVLREAARQLADYFAGRRTAFDLPLRPAGSPFQQRVWAAMGEIAYARTATYGDLARRIGTAARAVGGACGRNPLPIIIPCHRVVGGQGKAGGYSGLGGLETKGWLLAHERAHERVAATATAP